jgi:hypothetical protein
LAYLDDQVVIPPAPAAPFGDPHAGDFHRASTCDHALGPCSRHPGADEIDKESTVNPCASMIASLQTSGMGQAVRRVAALGLRAAPAA